MNSEERNITGQEPEQINKTEATPEKSEEKAPEILSEATEKSAEENSPESVEPKETAPESEAPKDEAEAKPEPAPEEKAPAESEQKPEPQAEKTEESETKDKAEAEKAEKPAETPEKIDLEEKKSEKSDDSEKSLTAEEIETIFAELKEKKDKEEVIEVEIKSRIRGGLRAIYKDFPLFLPASHFSIKRTPPEEELQEVVGTALKVLVHELQELPEGRKAGLVSRKKLLVDDLWNNLEVGQVIEGTISSIAPFGVFLDIGGVEGLIHVSRLSKARIEDPSKLFEKGQELKVRIVELDKERNRIALSHKEFEDSPWKGVDKEFREGEHYMGVVRRITNFGAYIELKPGVDGLLRLAEMSWTKRVQNPKDLFKPGQNITVEIMNVNTEKMTAALSYRRTQPNPWPELEEKYPVGAVVKGKVKKSMPQGAIITVEDEVDGFMPRSKMRPLGPKAKSEFEEGKDVEIKIADISPAEESLIIAPNIDDSLLEAGPKASPAKFGAGDQNSGAFSLMDMLSDKEKEKLKSISD